MQVKVISSFMVSSGIIFHVGEQVTIKYPDGGGCGGCKITQITKSGFHYAHGSKGRDKVVQFKNISEITLQGEKPISERKCTGKYDAFGTMLYEGDVIESLVGGQFIEIKFGRFNAYCPVDECTMDGVGFYAIAEGYPDMPIGSTEVYAKKIGDIYHNPELAINTK